MNAVVATQWADAAAVAERFPGWDVIRPMESVVGRTFERIVMLWHPMIETVQQRKEDGVGWVETLGGKLEWLV